MTTQVFARCHYNIFEIPDFFVQLHKFLGHFQIEQNIQQSYDQVFDLWFLTDIEIKEGETRQVAISCTRNEDDSLTFKIQKF